MSFYLYLKVDTVCLFYDTCQLCYSLSTPLIRDRHLIHHVLIMWYFVIFVVFVALVASTRCHLSVVFIYFYHRTNKIILCHSGLYACLSIRSTKEDKKMTEQLLANYYNNGVLSSILSGALLIMSVALISNFIKLIVPYTCISFFFSLKNMLRTHKVSLLPTGSFFISLFKFRLRWQLANCTLPITNIE